MLFLLVFILAGTVCIDGRKFDNPVLADKPYYNPGAIKVDETYYIISQTFTNTTRQQLVIHSSTDLINWIDEGFVFDDNNMPGWTNGFLWHPEIHKVNDLYLIYYGALRSSSGFAVGVAIATNPQGPYTPVNGPLVPDLTGNIYSPTIINDKESLYLVWSSDTAIFARQLTSAGLSFASDEVTTLLESDLFWEDGYIRSPWIYRRWMYYYLFYTANPSCNATGVGVARSLNPLGPYAKLAEPILVNNDKFNCTIGGSVLEDIDDPNHDIIVFTAFQANDVDQVSSILLASINFGDTDEVWPYVEDF